MSVTDWWESLRSGATASDGHDRSPLLDSFLTPRADAASPVATQAQAKQASAPADLVSGNGVAFTRFDLASAEPNQLGEADLWATGKGWFYILSSDRWGLWDGGHVLETRGDPSGAKSVIVGEPSGVLRTVALVPDGFEGLSGGWYSFRVTQADGSVGQRLPVGSGGPKVVGGGAAGVVPAGTKAGTTPTSTTAATTGASSPSDDHSGATKAVVNVVDTVGGAALSAFGLSPVASLIHDQWKKGGYLP